MEVYGYTSKCNQEFYRSKVFRRCLVVVGSVKIQKMRKANERLERKTRKAHKSPKITKGKTIFLRMNFFPDRALSFLYRYGALISCEKIRRN